MIKIPLIEDDKVDAMNVKRAFKEKNIANPLALAINALEALIMLRGENKIKNIPRAQRLILLDLNISKINTFEFLRELRTQLQPQHFPIVVLNRSNEE
ncbi:MAG TPA: hypothetical protein V6D09_05780 [Leptolyngbyaceae cyanobacterium]